MTLIMNGVEAVMGQTQVLVGQTMTLIGLPSQKIARQQLPGTIDDLVKAVAAIVEKVIASAISKRSAGEFAAAVGESFPVYFRSMISLSGILQAMVSHQSMEIMASESFCELEADFRDHAAAAFGADIQEQAMFTLWTLRKINDLSNIVVAAGKVADGNKTQDMEFAANYLRNALLARFHIDCLVMSMRTQRTIYPDVLGMISDGLRSAVDAYAWIRQAADLYAPQPEPELPMLEPDEEDMLLLAESMYDLDHEAA